MNIDSVIKAHHHASVKWLLSKAFNNCVPDNLKEPFYKDHENQERLKPQIIVELGNATLYCQTLSNLYSDPNYQSLNHWWILQTLTRKGVPVREVADTPITETVLIQTNPLKINAHMTVIESLMNLYVKEILSGDRMSRALTRISASGYQMQSDYEQSLLAWISHVCEALKLRIAKEVNDGLRDENDKKLEMPEIPPLRDFQDLCSGICLALLVSYYCPKILPWTSVRISNVLTIEDSVYNVLLVSNFSHKHLPYSVFHIQPEDVIFMKGPMKLHLIVLLADLFNLFEIHPAKCVCYPENNSDVVHSASASDERYLFEHQLDDKNHQDQEAQEEDFVVHKSRGISTLTSKHLQHFKQQDPLLPARLRQAKEKTNMESKADERGDNVPAGKPSNWEEIKRPSCGGWRSRRNSSSEDSQLTLENFCGSPDIFERSHERECERRSSNASVVSEPVVALRSSIADARGTLQIGYEIDLGSEKQDRGTEKYALGQSKSPHTAKDNFVYNQKQNSEPAKEFDDVGKLCDHLVQATFNTSLDNLRSCSSGDGSSPKRKSSCASTTFAGQQHIVLPESDQFDSQEDEARSWLDVSKLAAIRMKLEEKRRRIEQDKNNIEMIITRHHEKVGKPEFVEAINKLYGSQQHIANNQQHRSTPQQNFGSTPQLPQVLSNANNSRPPSRDHYQQQMLPLPTHCTHENGQYITNEQLQQAPLIINQPHFNMPSQNLYNENCSQLACSLSHSGASPHYQSDQYHHYYHSQHPQQKYVSRMDANYTPPLNTCYLQEFSTQSPQQMVRGAWPNFSQGYNVQEYQPQSSVADVVALQSNTFQSKAGTSIDCNKSQQNDYNIPLNSRDCEQEQAIHNYFQVHSSPQQLKHDTQNQQSTQFMPDKFRDYCSPNVIKSSEVRAKEGDDFMAPQSICFIGDDEDVEEIERDIIESMKTARLSEYNNSELMQRHLYKDHFIQEENCESAGKGKKLNITSGNLTYRIPSPSRPSLNSSSFQDPHKESMLHEKGFYISFDDDIPKRPKPPLRIKRSPRRDKNSDTTDHEDVSQRETANKFHSKFSKNECFENNFTKADNFDNGKSTYNKYTDPPIHLKLAEVNSHFLQNNPSNSSDRRYLEDVTNQQQSQSPTQQGLAMAQTFGEPKGNVLVIGPDASNLDANSVDEMERKKEKIMLLSLQRRQQQEEVKARKEIEANLRRERQREKEEIRSRKKEEQSARRAAILEQHRLKKAIEDAEREGKTLEKSDVFNKQQTQNVTAPRLRQQRITRQRPKTIHVDTGSVDVSESSSISSRGKKGSIANLTEPTINRVRTLSRISVAKGSVLNYRGRKSNSLVNLCDTDSGLGRTTPPRRAPSPGMIMSCRHIPSPSGPGSLPPGLISKRRGFDDGSSDISPTPISVTEYSGPKLYKQPEAKSNRGIILNAVEYCVFPGAVNRDAKQKVLEKIARSEVKHFLILFRDAGCQFRAVYGYAPERGHVMKLYGTGPSQVDEVMFDKFFKYNSGGKCFSQVHTKHLTVTIDAFTIHNSLWQGKKVHLPSKKDMALVI